MNKGPFDESLIFSMEGFETTFLSVAFTATSASSTAITGRKVGDALKGYVLLYATQDCHIRSTSGSSTAVTTDTFLPANIQVPYFISSDNIISVIRSSIDGTLNISPVA